MIKSGFKTRAGYDGACTVYEYLLKTDGSYNSDWVSIVRSRNKINFSFPFFSNFETNDKHTLTIMKEMTAACRQNPLCAKLDPFDRVACIRRCVSPMCYNQIYDSSPLEPGEIDTKYPGYKSCFHKLWKAKYRDSLNIT